MPPGPAPPLSLDVVTSPPSAHKSLANHPDRDSTVAKFTEHYIARYFFTLKITFFNYFNKLKNNKNYNLYGKHFIIVIEDRVFQLSLVSGSSSYANTCEKNVCINVSKYEIMLHYVFCCRYRFNKQLMDRSLTTGNISPTEMRFASLRVRPPRAKKYITTIRLMFAVYLMWMHRHDLKFEHSHDQEFCLNNSISHAPILISKIKRLGSSVKCIVRYIHYISYF
ncbi:hypothetical protein PUN28_012291 [Cardiocondyla obscurior]|uniref:Uncharacterized protein n=1 Tax=Cardiocondyla obscurior TaxID=286306 RepID=A0AAW2FBQ2_9HYME